MFFIFIVFFLLSLITDAMLFSSMKIEAPELYEKLGPTSNFSLMANPISIAKYVAFMYSSNPFLPSTASHSRFWFCRLSFTGVFATVTFGVFL